MVTKDRKRDRHTPSTPKGVFARLDPDDDAWFRRHIESLGLTVSRGVKAAVKAYRKQVEAETAEPQLITTREAADLLGRTKARLSDWDTRHRPRPTDETTETTPEEH